MRFYSKIAGARYIFPDGTSVIFAYGFLDVTEKTFPGVVVSPNPQFKLKDEGRPRYLAYQEELERLATEGNPLIFTQNTVKNLQTVGEEYKVESAKKAKSEVEIAAHDQAMRQAGVAGRETGDVNKGSLGGGDPNSSTIDPALQAQVFAPRTGPGAEAISRAQQLRAEAAARLQQQQVAGANGAIDS